MLSETFTECWHCRRMNLLELLKQCPSWTNKRKWAGDHRYKSLLWNINYFLCITKSIGVMVSHQKFVYVCLIIENVWTILKMFTLYSPACSQHSNRKTIFKIQRNYSTDSSYCFCIYLTIEIIFKFLILKNIIRVHAFI